MAEIRESKGLTQEEVGRLLGMTAAAYCRKEKGKRPLFAHELRSLASIFGVSLDDIDFFAAKPTATETTDDAPDS